MLYWAGFCLASIPNMKRLCSLLLVVLFFSACECWGEVNEPGGLPGFKMVTPQKKYAQREWQVPPQFFSSGGDKAKIRDFFQENRIKLSLDGQVSYVRGESKLMMSDTAKNLEKVDRLIRKYASSVEIENELVPSVSCAEIVEGKKKYISYPARPVSVFLADLPYDSGSFSSKAKNIYLLQMYNKDDEEQKKLAFELLRKLEGRKDIACIVVPVNYKSQKMIPEECKLPIIPANRLRREVNQVTRKYSVREKDSFSSNFEIEERYLNQDTRRGRFLIFLDKLVDSDFGRATIREGLYTGYGNAVSNIANRRDMLELLKKVDKERE